MLSDPTIPKQDQRLYRFFEIIPGLTTWMFFIAPMTLFYWFPAPVLIFFIIFVVFWFFRMMTGAIHLIAGYIQYRRDIKINWLEKCDQLTPKDCWKNIYHILIMATYKEEIGVLENSVKGIVDSNFPLKNTMFVLAVEERDKERGIKNAQILERKYGSRFFKFCHYVHPANLPDEVVGKGSNMVYAISQFKKEVDKEKIDYNNIIVTMLDADHKISNNYLSCLTYKYLTNPDPKHRTFQAVPMYFNNIWDVPLPMRMIAFGSSFWQMIESTRPHRLRNFASQAQSFAALIETDFWSKISIVEDGHQYWRSYFRFNGNHQVVPIFVPIYYDAVLAETYLKTFKEQYLQKRRWAWGVSDIPYVLYHSLKNKKISLIDRIIQAARLFEGHFSWSTTSVFLMMIGWLPYLVNPTAKSIVIGFNFPLVYGRLLAIAMIGMIVTLLISLLLLPPRPKNKKWTFWSQVIEWISAPIMLPIVNIFFGSMPAIDSQTKLMIGRYLGFRVTIKHRK